MLDRLVLYDPQVLRAVVGYYNEALWPAQIEALLLCLLAVALVLRPVALLAARSVVPGGVADRVVGGILAAGWVVSGVAWLGDHYAAINWAGAYYRWAFLAEAALIAWFVGVRRGLRFGATPERGIDGPVVAGVALALFAAIGHPLLELALGLGWSQLQLAGLMPDPTMVLTLALLACARGHGHARPSRRLIAVLAAIPVLWLILGGVWAWLLGAPERLVLPAAGLVGLGLIAWRGLRAKESSS